MAILSILFCFPSLDSFLVVYYLMRNIGIHLCHRLKRSNGNTNLVILLANSGYIMEERTIMAKVLTIWVKYIHPMLIYVSKYYWRLFFNQYCGVI